ncbi:MAG: hypothetical protein ACRCW9_06575 [Cetobacterium sp.]
MVLSKGFLIHQILIDKIKKCKEGESFIFGQKISFYDYFNYKLFESLNYKEETFCEIIRTLKFIGNIKYEIYYNPNNKGKEFQIKIIKKPKWIYLYSILIDII